MSTNLVELLVFKNDTVENGIGTIYSLGYTTSAASPIQENGINIRADGAVNLIIIQSGEKPIPPISVNPQNFEIQFQIENMVEKYLQVLPPIVIKGTGGTPHPVDDLQSLSTDAFLTNMEFDEGEPDPPAIMVKSAKAPFTIEFLIQSDKQFFSACTIYPDGITTPPLPPIPLAPGFIITCLQLN